MAFKRFVLVMCGLFFLLGAGACGQRVKSSLVPIDSSSRVPEAEPAMVLLPLADYSDGFSPDDALRRQAKVQRAVAYYLAQKGYYVPLEEDVVNYLADIGVITLSRPDDSALATSNDLIYQELRNGWSAAMVKQVSGIVENNSRMNRNRRVDLNMVGLTTDTLQKIGERFGASYVLRGRIAEYEIREDSTLDPIKKGILPFFFDFGSRTSLGFARTEEYDTWRDVGIGAGSGAVLFDSSDALWGAVTGASAGHLLSKSGYVPVAVVRLGLALQDVNTGKVVWANWVEKQVSPKSVWAGGDTRSQLDRAVEDAAYDLVSDLAGILGSLPRNQASRFVEPLPAPEPKEMEPASPVEEAPVAPVPKKENKPELWGS